MDPKQQNVAEYIQKQDNELQLHQRLSVDNKVLENITETKLLGVMINNTLTWDSNTKYITKRANVRMRMLQKLVEFNVPEEDNIFILYIRSVLELNLLRKCPHQNRSRLPGRQKRAIVSEICKSMPQQQ